MGFDHHRQLRARGLLRRRRGLAAEGEAAYALRPNLSLKAGVGRRWIERGHDRTYWNIGATATWKQLSLELRYEDTDLTPAQCGFTDWCQPSVIGTLRVDLPPII